MTHFSTRDQLLNYVNNPKQKGLNKNQKEKSIRSNVNGCDDNFDVFIEIENEIIKTARFDGDGCAISNGAMEAILNLIEGKKINEVSDIINIYDKFLKGETETISKELEVFKIVQTHISRRKCALAPIDAIRKVISS